MKGQDFGRGKLTKTLSNIYLEEDGVSVAPHVTPTLDLPQSLHIVVFTQRHRLLPCPGGHDGGQPGEDGGARHEEPRHHLDVHEEQGEDCHSCGVDHVHETFPAIVTRLLSS